MGQIFELTEFSGAEIQAIELDLSAVMSRSGRHDQGLQQGRSPSGLTAHHQHVVGLEVHGQRIATLIERGIDHPEENLQRPTLGFGQG